MGKIQTGLSLEQQLILEEKRIAFDERNKIQFGQELSYYEQLRILLPTFESLPPGTQAKFINAKQTIKYLIGGFQSGKTETAAALAIWLSYINRPYYGISVSLNFDNAKVIMFVKIKELCNKNGIRFDYTMHTSMVEVNFYFGDKDEDIGKIFLVSGQAKDAWIGMSAAFGLMDEPFRQSEDVDRDMVSRVSNINAVLSLIIYSGTPEPDVQEWGIEIVEDVAENDINDEHVFATRLSTRDNNKVREGYVQTLELKYDSDTAKTYIDGVYISLKGGKLYHKFDDKINLVPTISFIIKPEDYNRVLITYDFNVNPMTAIEFLIRAPEVYITEDYKIETSDTWELTDNIIYRLRKKYNVDKLQLYITGDRTALKQNTMSNPIYNPNFDDYDIIAKIFRREKIRNSMFIPEHNPDVQQRIQLVNNVFDKKYLWILDHCKDVREDLRYVKQKVGSPGFVKDKTKNKMRTHLSDNVDYGVWFAMAVLGVFPRYDAGESFEEDAPLYLNPIQER